MDVVFLHLPKINDKSTNSQERVTSAFFGKYLVQKSMKFKVNRNSAATQFFTRVSARFGDFESNQLKFQFFSGFLTKHLEDKKEDLTSSLIKSRISINL